MHGEAAPVRSTSINIISRWRRCMVVVTGDRGGGGGGGGGGAVRVRPYLQRTSANGTSPWGCAPTTEGYMGLGHPSSSRPSSRSPGSPPVACRWTRAHAHPHARTHASLASPSSRPSQCACACMRLHTYTYTCVTVCACGTARVRTWTSPVSRPRGSCGAGRSWPCTPSPINTAITNIEGDEISN